MPISTSSTHRAALMAFVLLATGALAQQAGLTPMQKEGDAAMARMRASVRQAKPPAKSAKAPVLPTPSEADQRRAFDALAKRLTSPALEARARAALQSGEAALASAREAQAKAIRVALGLEPDALKSPAPPSSKPTGWVPVLLVSSSMPLATLRTYAAQLERVHGVMAFRGMPGGLHKIGPMAKLSAEMLRLDPGCEGPNCTMRGVQLIVDPILFRQHGIDKVPTLLMIPGDPAQAYCEREADSPRSTHIVQGDSALSGLFDEYARLGGGREVRDAQALLAHR